MDHFDVSIWAFEKLADVKWGVIGIKYRRVPCEHRPDNPAPAIANPSPPPSQADWGELLAVTPAGRLAHQPDQAA